MRMDYLEHLRNMITKPLSQQGNDAIPAVLEAMAEYDITRDDCDAFEELQFKDFPPCPNLFDKIQTKTKTAFTRAYNLKQTAFTQLKKGKGAKGKAKPVIIVEETKKSKDEEEPEEDEAEQPDLL